MTALAAFAPELAPPALVRRGDRFAWRSRIAGAGVVAILLAVSVFAIWSSQATAAAAHRAATASRQSDDFAAAASAVAAEESLERKYRLEPGPAVRVRYNAAAAQLVTALIQVRADAGKGDRVLVDRLLGQHRAYLAAIDRMFRAVDRHDTQTVLAIDGGEVDPSFGAIEAAVLDKARPSTRRRCSSCSTCSDWWRRPGGSPRRCSCSD